MRLSFSLVDNIKFNQYFPWVIFFLYGLFVFCNAMDAYNLIFVPFTWVSKLGFIGLGALILCIKKFEKVPNTQPLFYLIAWSILITLLNILFLNYPSLMPERSNTSYPVFILLRFLNIFAFLSLIYVTFWLFRNGYKDLILKLLVFIGIIISIFAIYIYFAQIYGYFEPTRNRLGTSGGAQATSFLSVLRGADKSVLNAFHYTRALGTFREPSLLGAWLIVPFFLSFMHKKSIINIPAIIIAAAILLTWSLSTIVTLVFAFAIAIFVGAFFSVEKKYFKLGLLLFRVLLASSIAFSCVQISNTYFVPTKTIPATVKTSHINSSHHLVKKKKKIKYHAKRPKKQALSSSQIMSKRIQNIYKHGLKNSNRTYTYKYMHDSGVKFFGYGLGNSNILLGNYVSSNFPPHYSNSAYLMPNSFLSLYGNFAYSTGLIGLLLLMIFLGKPIVIFFRKDMVFFFENSILLFAAYVSWLGLFAIHLEEFSAMFGMIFVFFVDDIYGIKQIQNSIRTQPIASVNMHDPVPI